MEPKEIVELIKDRFPAEIKEIKEFREQVSVIAKKDRIKEIMRYLHDAPELYFDYLEDLCGVDNMGKKEPRFDVVYHLYSMRHRHMIRIKAEVPEDDCAIDSVTEIWAGADWHERECWDLFGIKFDGHPDLRRILLPEDWEGYPLRKDYPLKADLGEMEWKGYKEVLETAERNKQYEVDR
ncbi:MAG: NADH dehydrogenase [Nitrospirae bacterium GWC2_46_6]|nr:MAG: NADH dehydrogenase [Nitrospirae bacterium GWC2_46_6]OGW24766.1 MAG: NADH dehydrogenase [Nitrospirae bacterium GWB2_47_37]HAK88670.1 NADH-quinone oxidoreductase subunit C [Nitrospiraceae bacterium]HCL81949.1 NADH-quinone oxidoreductase subunit C [Nitrospiraceae bacterium]